MLLLLLVLGQVPDSKPLEWTGDLSARMVAGISRFLDSQNAKAASARAQSWNHDYSSAENYERSVASKRDELRRIIGAIDRRLTLTDMQYVSGPESPSRVAENERYTVHRVRWSVFPLVNGEGLLFEPKGPAKANVVAIPDCGLSPEFISGLEPGLDAKSQFARLLAEAGYRVIIPVLVDRTARWSGNERIKRKTNQPHREWIYRQAYQLGRHIIGYEVQKVLAAVDWFERINPKTPILTVGYGEGGLLSLYSAAIDRRIAGAYVGGYFESREKMFQEPIDRNLFGLLRTFGDAEIGSMILPRVLWIDHVSLAGQHRPQWSATKGETPGRIETPSSTSFLNETKRLRSIAERLPPTGKIVFGVVDITEDRRTGDGTPGDPLCPGLARFLDAFGFPGVAGDAVSPAPANLLSKYDVAARQRRQVEELTRHSQQLLVASEKNRRDYWNKAKPTEAATWTNQVADLRKAFRYEVIGSFDDDKLPPNPRSRKLKTTDKWTLHEVVLDVWPDVFAWGYLLIPNGMKENEQRPVVVCQHGLEGVPEDVIATDPKHGGYRAYKGFAAALADRGFVVFAPHNPYRGRDEFRVLQRKANPLGRSLFSIIVGQHEVITDWLASLPFVDSKRIAFYGLSYGGKTAMRVPALVDRYCMSICSADFNEWIKKNVTVEDHYSYMYTGEYEMYEWNLGNTFNYAEMAALIAPRPFMVERGHYDGVAPDEWVAYEFAKVRRLYAELGVPERTEIEFFKGPHTINGIGTFAFLHRHLNWPAP